MNTLGPTVRYNYLYSYSWSGPGVLWPLFWPVLGVHGKNSILNWSSESPLLSKFTILLLAEDLVFFISSSQ